MTLDLLIDTFSMSLEHISSILGVVERELMPKYPLGLKVRHVDANELYKAIYFGEICGFEYFSNPKFPDLGWSYSVDVEFSYFLFKDGTEKSRYHTCEFLLVHESSIQELETESSLTIDWSSVL